MIWFRMHTSLVGCARRHRGWHSKSTGATKQPREFFQCHSQSDVCSFRNNMEEIVPMCVSLHNLTHTERGFSTKCDRQIPLPLPRRAPDSRGHCTCATRAMDYIILVICSSQRCLAIIGRHPELGADWMDVSYLQVKSGRWWCSSPLIHDRSLLFSCAPFNTWKAGPKQKRELTNFFLLALPNRVLLEGYSSISIDAGCKFLIRYQSFLHFSIRLAVTTNLPTTPKFLIKRECQPHYLTRPVLAHLALWSAFQS